MLAILKAGGAYLPLDPSYPAERLALIFQDTQIGLLLTQKSLLSKLPQHQARVICLDINWEETSLENQQNLTNVVTANNLAYVMYTSGSTGKPKGVSIVHQSVVRLVNATNYARFAEEVFLQLAPISFDASTFEIWGCLLNGAKLVVMPARAPSLKELGRAIQKYQVTILWLTASLFHLMVDEHLEDLLSVRQLLAGGDVLSAPHLGKLLSKTQDCQLINGYGPTENTTFTCCYPITKLSQLSSSVPIGRPIANTEVYILDRFFQPVPIGVIGELYIGGMGLARGYFNLPELTASKFIPNPFSKLPGARLYKTGDLVRYLSDGNIEFIGRADTQVKVRGFRIELQEIEALLSQHPNVRQAIVIVSPEEFNKRLVAYIVTDIESLDTKEMRQFLLKQLPEYMIPNSFVQLDVLPLTLNGKVDRQRLSAALLSSKNGRKQHD